MKENILPKQNKRGVTLIALVVTIVVLLILAAVSIQMLGGENGIILQSKNAKELTRYSNVKEAYELWQVEHSAESNSKSKKEFIEDLGPNGTMKYLTEEEVKEIYDTGKITIADKTIMFFAKLDTLTFESNEITIIKNGTTKLNILEDVEGVELRWSNSNAENVSINNGELRGIQNGQATITCSVIDDENLKAQCNVNVVDASEIYGEVDGIKLIFKEINQENLIDKVEYIYNENEITVYNFEVQDNHNYFVSENSILVHNPPTPTTCSIETGTTFRGNVYEIE